MKRARCHTAWCALWMTAAAAALHLSRVPTAWAQFIEMGSVTGQQGAAQLAVSAVLETLGLSVASTENVFSFDCANTPIASTSSGAPDCTVNPSIQKDSSTFSFLPPGCSGTACTQVRAIISSSANTAPIPDGSTLYTCKVSISSGAAAGDYPLETVDATAWDTSGQELASARAHDGEVDVIPTLTIGSATARQGSQVTIAATLSMAGNSVIGTHTDIFFDSVNTPIAATSNGTPDCTVNPGIHKDFSGFRFLPSGCSGTACTQVRAMILSSSDADPIPDGSLLYTCKVDISPGARGGTYTLRISEAMTPTLARGMGTGLAPLVPVGVDGVLNVPCVGDCNGDGLVTLSEVGTTINVSLGNLALSICPYADGNHDGAVMPGEIVQAENNIAACVVPSGPPGSALLQIGSASTSPTAQVSVPVSLAQSGGAVAAVQLDLLYDSAVFSDPNCSIEPRLGQHTLYTSLPTSPPAPAGQTRLRLMVLNPNSPSLLTDGVLARCTFHVASTAPNGTYTIAGERLGACDAAGVPCSTGVTNGQVTVSSAYIRVVANYPGAGRAVGAGLQDYFGVALVPGASITVTVTTLTPGLCRVWSSSPGDGLSTTVIAASASNLFWVQGVDGVIGTCQLRATAAGYTPGFSWLSIVPPAIRISNLPGSIPYSAPNAAMYVEIGVPKGDNSDLAAVQAAWEGGAGFDITVSNSDATVAQLFAPSAPQGAQVVTVTIPAGEYFNVDGGLQFDPLVKGTTTVTARHPVVQATTRATRPVLVTDPPPPPPSCSGCC